MTHGPGGQFECVTVVEDLGLAQQLRGLQRVVVVEAPGPEVGLHCLGGGDVYGRLLSPAPALPGPVGGPVLPPQLVAPLRRPATPRHHQQQTEIIFLVLIISCFVLFE